MVHGELYNPGSPPEVRGPGDRGARALVLASAVLFGTTGTAQALGPAANAVEVGAARIAVGGAALVAVALVAEARKGQARGDRGLSGAAVLVSAGGVAAYQLCFFAALAGTGVAVGTIVALGSAPAFTGLLSWLSGGRRPGARWLAATLLAVAGCALLVLPDGATAVAPLGVSLALGAGASYALYTVSSKALLDAGHPPARVMALAFGLGGLALVPVLVLGDSGWLTSPAGLALAAYLGLVPTTLAYGLFARGLRRLAPPTVATLTLAEPLTAALLGVVVLGERPTAAAAGGALLVLGGLALASVQPRRRERRSGGRGA